MDALLAKKCTEEWIRQNSGVELHRPYLGMSQIGRCQRMLYEWFYNGKGDASFRAHLNCLSGYMHEHKILDILTRAGICGGGSRELVAPFDERFRGHIDGVTVDGALIEIKTFDEEGYLRVTRTREIPRVYSMQVQAYLRYGDFKDALVVAVNRKSFEQWFLSVPRDDVVGKQVEEKAKRVLAWIDARRAPPCECGQCEVRR